MMVKASQEAARYVDEGDIIVSVERYMKCGRGICGSCEMDGYRTCVDGPVFQYKKIKGGDFGNRKRLKSGRRVPV
jgi:dihydroorotate dehydrogenase electron transfer subunit